MVKEDYVAHAFKEIEEGVKNVYSSDNFQNYLKFSAKFHDYSINNTMLILTQFPEATFVAGYSAWKTRFHRQVRKGEKAIKILAPYQVNLEDEETKKVETITKFRMVNVFDISQTAGEPIPTLVNELEGTSYNSCALRNALINISKTPIIFKNEDNDVEIAKGVKGYYNHNLNIIVVNEDLEDIHMAKTLIHEYAHSLIHKQSDKPTEQKEIEAESIAYVVCNHFDIDTSEYSFGYIASYANKDIEELKTILDNIQTFAHELIIAIEPQYQKELFLIQYLNGYVTPKMYEDTAIDLVELVYGKLAFKSEYNLEIDENAIKAEIEATLNKEPEWNFIAQIYFKNAKYQKNLIKWINEKLHSDLDLKDIHPFIDNSIEHRNYLLLSSLAKPIIEKKATYIRYQSSAMMDFNIEIIDENEIAISHYYECNGDMMADPDVTLRIDNHLQLAYPLSYSQDNLGYYINIQGNPDQMNDLNYFIEEWLYNIERNSYQISEIHLNEKPLSVDNDLEEIKKELLELNYQEFYNQRFSYN